MGKEETFVVLWATSFCAAIVATVWLTRRATPPKRIYWFLGCSAAMLVMFGLLRAPIAIAGSVAFLAMLRTQEDSPARDVAQGFIGLFGSAIGLAMGALYFGIPLGWMYWLWLAIQMGSFAMFVYGLFPFTAPIAAIVGLYALAFHPPPWVTSSFGG